MADLIYPALIEHAAPGEFCVTFRDIPEAVTGGATFAESFSLAIDALSVAVEGLLLGGRAIPRATPAQSGEVMVPLDPAIAARVLLDSEMTRLSLSGRALAERMGKDEKNIRRILSGEARIDQTLAALNELGVRPALSLPDPPIAA